MSQGYNGWANWETWIINLYFGDDQQWLFDMAEQCDFDQSDFADALETYVYDYVEDMDGKLSGLVSEFFTGCMKEVDWQELAENYLSDMDIPTEEEEETI